MGYAGAFEKISVRVRVSGGDSKKAGKPGGGGDGRLLKIVKSQISIFNVQNISLNNCALFRNSRSEGEDALFFKVTIGILVWHLEFGSL